MLLFIRHSETIEDHRISHVKRIDNNRNVVILKYGDIVMVWTVIQGDLSRNKVADLCYAIRGPHHITCRTCYGSYFIKKLHKPDSLDLKFMAYDLYSFPLSLELCESVDTSETQYLN